ncbi:sodium-dependent transporter [Algiphilus sp.]|uniref:sodium-dependent transporter n=1 Tax=Algiphilus sp. TaxID=1872431 RepID=UPI0025BFA286|nr:sodium-dependent transporter [Algiphilus sp.]MCK5770586.1 sodium-dependent transporter [Algiphilus sp.]
MTTREHWGSRLGFVMAAAGSAVGLGNIWRFPYTAGENGGGAFLLIYLGIIAVFGVSVLLAEIVLGRVTQRNPVGAFKQLGGPVWALAGLLGVITGFVILSFYIVVAGWTLAYVGFSATGAVSSTDPAVLESQFGAFVGGTWAPLGYAAVFMVLVAVTVAGGIGRGIERANKVLMPLLFLLLIALAVRALTLPGGGAGVAFLLQPDFSKVSGATFSAALAQAFFSLSLGMGTMITYGSYLGRHDRLGVASGAIISLDVLAAMLAGLVIMPVVFAFGFSPSAGAGLTFITLPAAFAAMPGGTLIAPAFFLLLAVAALTSALSILEPAISWLTDERGWSRPRTVWACALLCFALGVPSSLSMGAADLTLFGRTFFDTMDFAATGVMLPVGALLTSIFVGWFWGHRALVELADTPGADPWWSRAWLLILRFIAPPALVLILLQSTGVI